MALLLVVSITSGAISYRARKRLQNWNHSKEPGRAGPVPTQGEDFAEEIVVGARAAAGEEHFASKKDGLHSRDVSHKIGSS